MKNIISLFLVCTAAFAFAQEPPVFEETEEKITLGTYAQFAITDPIFEEDDEKETKTPDACGCGGSHDNQENQNPPQNTENPEPNNQNQKGPEGMVFKDPDLWLPLGDQKGGEASYISWPRYKANFGIEKVFVRFPFRPIIAQSNALLTAHVWDFNTMYSLTGYFPPIGSISPAMWFDEILFSVDNYPFKLISHVVFQAYNGDWLMDYVAHDYVQNTIIKARAVVTPFNGYILQCVKPNGERDYFDYFLDNFFIRCE